MTKDIKVISREFCVEPIYNTLNISKGINRLTLSYFWNEKDGTKKSLNITFDPLDDLNNVNTYEVKLDSLNEIN